MSKWDKEIAKVKKVRNETMPKEKINQESENLDEFTHLKKNINNKIKKIRLAISKKQEFIKKKDEHSRIIYTNNIINAIDSVYKDTEVLHSIQERDAKKCRADEKFRRLLINRDDIIRLIFNHIEECKMLNDGDYVDQKLYGNESNENKDTIIEMAFTGKIVNLPEIDSIPDLTAEEGFKMQDEKDIKINKLLDDMLNGMIDIKNIAENMKNQLETQDIIIEEITENVDKENEQLITLNTQLKKTLKRIRSPKKVCVDIILICMFLGLIGLIVKIIYDNTKSN